MYSINIKSISKKKWIFRPVFLVAIIILISLTYLISYGVFYKYSYKSSIKAMKIDDNCSYDYNGEKLCYPEYHYLIAGKEYICKVNKSISIINYKDKKIVYYDSNNPNKCITGYDLEIDYHIYIFLGLDIVILLISGSGIIYINKKIKKIKYLEKNGKLVRMLEYEVRETDFLKLKYFVVDYKLATGELLHLRSDIRFDGKLIDNDGRVDMLIDDRNEKKLKYYIDLEIKKLDK